MRRPPRDQQWINEGRKLALGGVHESVDVQALLRALTRGIGGGLSRGE
jgi:hypothetical protein